MSVELFLLTLMIADPYSNLRIEDYCKEIYPTNPGYAWRCRNKMEAAENDLSKIVSKDRPALHYCKNTYQPPHWDEIKDCFNRQMKYKKRYKSAATRADSVKVKKCEAMYDEGDWSGKVFCVSRTR